MLTRFARLVSIVFSPFVIAVPLVVSLTVTHSPSAGKAIVWGLVALGAAAVVPLLVILLLMHYGAAGDLHLTLRADRPLPFLIGVAGGVVGAFLLWALGAPRVLMTVSLAFISIGILITATTLFWKVSIHMAALSAAVTTTVLIYGTEAAALFFILPLVGWARLRLKKHTLAQLVAGTVGPATGVLVVFLVRELR